jgi:hypothetical protein
MVMVILMVKFKKEGHCICCHILIIPATQEAESRRIVVQDLSEK